MTDLVFFYGTLMSGFKRPGSLAHRSEADLDRARLDPRARCSISASIRRRFRPPTSMCWGSAPHDRLDGVLAALDEIEGYRPNQPDASLYTRVEAPVTLDDGRVATAWVYFYNAPLGRAQRIESGDYLQHLKVK